MKRDYPPDQITKALFPFLERPFWEEWDLIQAKKSTLSRMQRDKISDLASKMEAHEKDKKKKK